MLRFIWSKQNERSTVLYGMWGLKIIELLKKKKIELLVKKIYEHQGTLTDL